MYADYASVLIRIEILATTKGRTSQRPVDDPDLFLTSTETTTLAGQSNLGGHSTGSPYTHNVP